MAFSWLKIDKKYWNNITFNTETDAPGVLSDIIKYDVVLADDSVRGVLLLSLPSLYLCLAPKKPGKSVFCFGPTTNGVCCKAVAHNVF